MEDDKSKSLSDKDRDMAGRFGGASKESEDKDKEKEEKKESSEKKDEKKTPKRSLFGLEKPNESKNKNEEKLEKENKGLFDGLLKESVRKEDQTEDIENSKQNVENLDFIEDQENKPITPELEEDFEEVIVERLQSINNELENTELENPQAAEADAAFLSTVSERISEGLPPEDAINDALEDEYAPPNTDALSEDLIDKDNFVKTEDEEEPEPLNRNRAVYYPPMPGSASVSNGVNTLPQEGELEPMNDSYYRKRRSGDLLLGGIVGYMVGRRGGRKRTEARLEPQIEQNQNDIMDLKNKLTQSEQKVREIALQNSSRQEITQQQEDLTIEKQPLNINKVEKSIEKIKITSIDRERQIIEKEENKFENDIEKLRVTEQNRPELVSEVLEKTVPQEIINRVGVSEKISANENKAPNIEVLDIKKDPKTMTLPELLEVADNIMLENTSLKELFEYGRIDAVNLRRVVIEYLSGGKNYERILRGSLEAVEMQRELRNEIKRDSDFSSPQGGGASGSNSDELARIGQPNEANSSNQKNTEKGFKLDATQDEQDTYISNNAAIVLGVLSGVVLMLLFLLITR